MNELENDIIPKIDEILSRISTSGSVIFTKIDLREAYLKVEIDESSRYVTSFTYNNRYQFKRAIYGLKCMPVFFTKLINKVLNDCGKYVESYIDDIVIHSKSIEEHHIHVKEVLRRLTEANLDIKLEKCQFYTDNIEILETFSFKCTLWKYFS
jgi:hypothetical protein